jgi:hypothetical protein
MPAPAIQTVDVEEQAHAEMGPSSADRWMICTASVSHNRAHGVNRTTDAAEEGSLAHEVFEADMLAALKAIGLSVRRHAPSETSLLQDSAVRGKYDLDTISEDVTSVVERAMDAVRESLPGARVWVEEKVRLGAITEAVWGTADCVIWQPELDRLTVVDLKYGRWPVDPKGNRQLTIYALGALASLLRLRRVPSDIRLVIAQPRTGNIWNEWKMPAGYLMDDFVPALRRALASIDSGDVEWAPGDKACRFCPGAAMCPALLAKAREVEQGLFADLDRVDVLAEALQLTGVLSDWVNKVQEAATEKLLAGESIPGWKLVEGRSTRKWTDDEAVKSALREAGLRLSDITETKLCGIPAIEKLIKRNKKLDHSIIDPYIVRSQGRSTLAPETDKRPAIARIFKNLET